MSDQTDLDRQLLCPRCRRGDDGTKRRNSKCKNTSSDKLHVRSSGLSLSDFSLITFLTFGFHPAVKRRHCGTDARMATFDDRAGGGVGKNVEFVLLDRIDHMPYDNVGRRSSFDGISKELLLWTFRAATKSLGTAAGIAEIAGQAP